MEESVAHRIGRIAEQEVFGYIAIASLMLLVVALVLIALPVAGILKEPVLWVMDGALFVMEGMVVSGWILVMLLGSYPVLILALLLVLLIAVLLIRKIRKSKQD